MYCTVSEIWLTIGEIFTSNSGVAVTVSNKHFMVTADYKD